MPASQRSSAQPGVSLAGIADLGPKLKITLVKSTIGYNVRQKATAKALGLRKMNQTVVKPNNPQMRGMVLAIQHLVYVEGADDATATGDSE